MESGIYKVSLESVTRPVRGGKKGLYKIVFVGGRKEAFKLGLRDGTFSA